MDISLYGETLFLLISFCSSFSCAHFFLCTFFFHILYSIFFDFFPHFLFDYFVIFLHSLLVWSFCVKTKKKVDQNLIPQVSMGINGGLGVVSAGCAIIVATPIFTFVLAPLSLLYFRIMSYFRQVAIELKRLESITK